MFNHSLSFYSLDAGCMCVLLCARGVLDFISFHFSFFSLFFSHFTGYIVTSNVSYNMAFYIYLLDHLVGYWLAWLRIEIALR